MYSGSAINLGRIFACKEANSQGLFPSRLGFQVFRFDAAKRGRAGRCPRLEQCMCLPGSSLLFRGLGVQGGKRVTLKCIDLGHLLGLKSYKSPGLVVLSQRSA